jgi:hypothetical protein
LCSGGIPREDHLRANKEGASPVLAAAAAPAASAAQFGGISGPVAGLQKSASGSDTTATANSTRVARAASLGNAANSSRKRSSQRQTASNPRPVKQSGHTEATLADPSAVGMSVTGRSASRVGSATPAHAAPRNADPGTPVSGENDPYPDINDSSALSSVSGTDSEAACQNGTKCYWIYYYTAQFITSCCYSC